MEERLLPPQRPEHIRHSGEGRNAAPVLLLFFSYSGLQLSWNIGEKRGQKSVPSGKRRVLGVERKVEVVSGQGPTMSKVQVNPGREGSGGSQGVLVLSTNQLGKQGARE